MTLNMNQEAVNTIKERARRKLERDMGPTFLAALHDPKTIEIMLNAVNIALSRAMHHFSQKIFDDDQHVRIDCACPRGQYCHLCLHFQPPFYTDEWILAHTMARNTGLESESR